MSRERTYADHAWGRGGQNDFQSRHFDVLHLYSVNGRASSSDAWRYQRAIFNPTANRNALYRAHRIGMSAVEDDTAGPSGGGVYRTDDYAAFFLRPETDRIAFDVRQAPDSAPQTVTVRVDGHMVGRLSLSGDTWRSIEHPVEPRDVGDSPFCIELLVSPAAHDVESRSQGVMLVGEREDLKETRLRPTARCCGRWRHRQANSVRVCSPTSRRVASLRPRFAGLTALTPAPRTLVQTGSC